MKSIKHYESMITNKSTSSVIFRDNMDMPIHRWFHYAEGFSNEFVNSCLEQNNVLPGDLVYEPFMGSGTVGVSAKLKGIDAIGVELSPLMYFVSSIKNNFETYEIENIEHLKEKFTLPIKTTLQPPKFLKNEKHFDVNILERILCIKEAVWKLPDVKEKDIFKLAFANILLKSSNAKRIPSFGYKKKSNLDTSLPIDLFNELLEMIVKDIKRMKKSKLGNVEIVKGDSRQMHFKEDIANIAITSPPYANGIDYVTDYQLEMGWLELIDVDSRRLLRDGMVAYDKTRVKILRDFYNTKDYYDEENLMTVVKELEGISKDYWKKDIHLVVLKYFNDMYEVFMNTYNILKKDAKFILVLGDSLFKDVYVPADLLLAIMGEKVGFTIEAIELARDRYSGQNRSFRLRETILTLKK
jgi:DNA modification methylase